MRKGREKVIGDELVELLAQIFLTIEECPEFYDMTIDDVFEFAGLDPKDNTYMNRLVTIDSAFKLLQGE